MLIPEIPPGMDSWSVPIQGGGERSGVGISDAGRLIGVKAAVITRWITSGKVEVALNPQGETIVLVDSLWEALPPEVKG
jgi:hypothetical protein